MGLKEVLANNKRAGYWYNLLSDEDKRTLPPVFDAVFAFISSYVLNDITDAEAFSIP